MYCISVLFYLAFLAKSSFSYLIKSIANIYANLNNSYGKISDLLQLLSSRTLGIWSEVRIFFRRRDPDVNNYSPQNITHARNG